MNARKRSLSSSWERVRTVPGLGRDVTAIAVIIVGAMVSLGVMYPKMTTAFPWDDRKIVRAEFERVPGVNPNSSHKVTMAGVIVGQIVGWEATERGTGILDLDIDGENAVYENARAVIRAKNVLNDMTVEIDPGGPPAPELAEDGFIPVAQTERPVQVDGILNNLDERTQAALSSLLVQSDAALVRAPEQLPAGFDATGDTLGAIQPVMERLQDRREKIAQLVSGLASVSQAIGRNDAHVAELVDATQQTLTVLADNDDALRASLEQFPELNSALRDAMDAVRPLTHELNKTIEDLDDAADELPKAFDRFGDTVKEIDRTVEAAEDFVDAAKPVFKGLRPLAADVNSAMRDLEPVAESLKRDTETLVTYTSNIQAFVYNTRSVFGAGDGPEQAIIRGHYVFRLPDGGGLVGGMGGYAPGPENGLGENR